MNSLSIKQQQVVDSEDQYISVIAGAGSGKTRVVTAKIMNSVHRVSEFHKILAITFSNKATEELKKRLIESLGEEKTTNSVYIGTIHNFCNEILMTYGHLIGIPDNVMICSNSSDRLAIFQKAVEAVPQLIKDLNETADAKKRYNKISSWLEAISIEKRKLKFATDYDKSKNLYALFKEFDDQLLNQGMIDFDDIVRYTYKLLACFPAVLETYQKTYKEIYVDEAQDINLAQYEIVKLVAGKHNRIIMVGDPNQAIYGFSGGSSEFLKTIFSRDYIVTNFTLNENYRSAQSIISASNKLETTFNAECIYPIQGEFTIEEYSNEEEEAIKVYNKICELMNEGNENLENRIMLPANCAVIARNRYVFNKLTEIFDKNKINYALKVSPRGSFSSESDVMRIFELGLILIGNELDIVHRTELNSILKTQNLKRASDIEQSNEIEPLFKSKLMYVVNALKKLGDGDVNLTPILDQISTMFSDATLEFNDLEKAQIQEDISFWRLNWSNYVSNSSIGERHYANFIRKISLVSSSAEFTDAITLSTVHMTKGLEYDVVFVIGLNDGVFPDYRAVQDLSNGNNTQMDEEKHDLFVAITRAKRLCYLSYPRKRMMPWGDEKVQTPSRFIKLL
jgi:DNA helicase-2/ATP-dependent DNA helicase PcrA